MWKKGRPTDHPKHHEYRLHQDWNCHSPFSLSYSPDAGSGGEGPGAARGDPENDRRYPSDAGESFLHPPTKVTHGTDRGFSTKNQREQYTPYCVLHTPLYLHAIILHTPCYHTPYSMLSYSMYSHLHSSILQLTEEILQQKAQWPAQLVSPSPN